MAGETHKLPYRLYECDPAMAHLKKVLEAARRTKADREVVEGLERVLQYVELREDYTMQCTSEDSAVCKKVEKDTWATPWEELKDQGKTTEVLRPGMLTGSLEGQFLKSLVSAQRARRVLDVGMYTGYSALSMAEALPAGGELVTLDFELYLKDRNQAVFGRSRQGRKITIKMGKALDSMRQLLNQGKQFDFVFVDSIKTEAVDYLKLCFEEGLLAENGTVAVDNAYRYGESYLPSDDVPDLSRQLRDHVTNDRRLHKVLVPIRDGVLLIRRATEVEPDLTH